MVRRGLTAPAAIVRPMSFGLTPAACSNKFIDTDRAPRSAYATRDWLDPRRRASSTWVMWLA